MQQKVFKLAPWGRWALAPVLLLLAQQAWSQCTNTTAFGSATINTNGSLVTISTCSFAGEYSTISSAVNGQTLRFTSSVATDFITIRSGTSGGAVVAFGTTPLTFANTFTGTLFAHWNTNAACGTQNTCRTTTVQCTSCVPPPPPANDLCTGAISISCNQTIAASTSAATTDAATPTCITALNTAPGVWYSLVGNGSSITLSLCGSGYDTKLGVFSGTCAALTCVTGNDDFCGVQSQVTFTSVAGTTYYVLVTGFSAGSGAFTLKRTDSTPAAPTLSSTAAPCIGGAVTLSIASGSLGSAAIWQWYSGSCGGTPIGTGTSINVNQSAATSYFARGEGGCVITPGACGSLTVGMETTLPTIVCPPNQPVGVNAFCQGIMPAFSGTVSDNCAGPYSQSQSPAAASGIAGNTTVTLTATDAVGNTGTCQFQVTVNDLTPPTISCPAQQTINANATCQGAVPSYTGLGIAADNCSLPANAVTQTPAIGTLLALGTTTVTLQVTDGSGLTATCNFTTRVVDATPPTFTSCPANITKVNDINQCRAVTTWAAPTAADNCVVPTIVQTAGLANGASFQVGVTPVSFRATDAAGNSSTCSFNVTVNDTQLPTVTCPANIVRGNDPNLCGAIINYNTPVALDNCGISSVSLISGSPASAFYAIGTVTNEWRATDLSNNVVSCSFNVTVSDTQAPTITCPANILKGADFGDCSANLGNTIGTVTSQDNCGVTSVTNNNPGIFPVGVTIVTWIAKDGPNSGSCTQRVTIEDREWPYVTCPSNIQVKTDEGDCVASVDYSATATDNCPGVSLDFNTPPPASFDIGVSLVVASATDAAGHTSTCTFQIFVGRNPEICNDFDDDCDGWVDEAQSWPALVKRFATDGAAAEEYGVSVGIDGDYAIVGSKQKSAGQTVGSAYILFRDKNGTNEWGQIIELSAPGLQAGDNFGASVAIAGGVAAVGAPSDDDLFANQGSVYIYHQNANNPAQWDFEKKIAAGDANTNDNFGASVALNSGRLVAGANQNDASGSNAGAAYIFYRNLGGADNWGQAAKLLAITGAADDGLGVSVDIHGDFAIVGANGVDGLQQNTGAAYIFGRNQFGADAWGQVARLRPSQPTGNDNFGATVGISGPWAIVGADRNSLKGANAGAAFFYNKNQNGILNSWGQSQIVLDYDGQAGDRFGSAVGIDGAYAVITARGDNPFGGSSGSGFVFLLDGNHWARVDYLFDNGGQNGDALGSSAAISGRNIILGAPLDNTALSDQGSVVLYGGLCDTQLRPGGDGQQRDDLSPNASEASVHCFPVPFSDVLNIEVKGIKSADAQLTILNAMGQVVTNLYKGAIETDMIFQWQAMQAADGLYFLRMTTGEKVVTQTIVRTK
ncbi:MAG: HYR domain-containing protein [Saprospiraceae bacterium]